MLYNKILNRKLGVKRKSEEACSNKSPHQMPLKVLFLKIWEVFQLWNFQIVINQFQLKLWSEREQIGKTYSSTNALSKKYRKMIPNLKMRKSNQTCTVCIQKFTENQIIKQLPCKHILHRQCAKSWLKINKGCPVCRFDLQKHFVCKQREEKQINKESQQ